MFLLTERNPQKVFTFKEKGKKLKIVLVVRMAIPYTERKKRKDEGDNKMGLLNGFSINDTEHE